MKKYCFIYLLAALVLSSCARYNNFFDKLYSSNSNIEIKNYSSTDDNPSTKAEDDTKQPVAKLNLIYKSKTYEVDAEAKLTVPDNYNNKVYFKWQPPKSSKCYTSSFMLISTENSILDTQSVLDRDNNVCEGVWTAKIFDKKSKNILAKASTAVS